MSLRFVRCRLLSVRFTWTGSCLTRWTLKFRLSFDLGRPFTRNVQLLRSSQAVSLQSFGTQPLSFGVALKVSANQND